MPVQIQVLLNEDQKDDSRWLDTRLASLNSLIEVKPDGKVRIPLCAKWKYNVHSRYLRMKTL